MVGGLGLPIFGVFVGTGESSANTPKDKMHLGLTLDGSFKDNCSVRLIKKMT